MKPYYVLLTGSINNAGDFLIKHRAKQLLEYLRPDRAILDFDRWKPLDQDQIVAINRSKGLILTGGPSLRPDMHPQIFPLTPKLENITVPILTMGVGWNHSRGSWHDTHNYGFTSSTRTLLDKIAANHYFSGVRDYHTLNTVARAGYDNFLMTGCPALYDRSKINVQPILPEKIQNISFSLGTRFLHSSSMEQSVKSLIAALQDRFSHERFTIVFHHSVNPADYEKRNTPILTKQLKMLEWMRSKGIAYSDISGDAQNLIDHYAQTDLHIGYRVHAHIYCSSISKPSILIAEDGRGMGLMRMNIGLVLPGFRKFRLGSHTFSKAGNRIIGKYVVDEGLSDDVIHAIDYEERMGFPRLLQARSSIDNLFPVMEQYVQQLP